MKLFACGDVIPGCGATFAEPTVDLVLAAVGRHAADDHGLVDVTPDVVAAVTGAIRTATPA